MWLTPHYRQDTGTQNPTATPHLEKPKYERSEYFENFSEVIHEDRQKIREKHVATPLKHPLSDWTALIDMNSYFATLEQQANPNLRGKPVGVLKEAGRSCIIAASKEAKLKGVKTGCSLYDARILCPDLITVPADFDRYFHNTKLLRSIFEELSPDVYIFSLDEAFLDLTQCKTLYPSAEALFIKARKLVHDRLGEWVNFSLGVGQNRLQAKLASEFAGKDNFFEMTAENVDICLAECKVEDICGIGYRLTQRLHQLNITVPYQIRFFDDAFLHEHFGPFWGPELRRISLGKNSHLLSLIDAPPAHMKSVSRSKTLFKATANEEYLQQMVYNLAEDMCFKARRMDLVGQHIGFSFRDIDGQHFGIHIKLKSYVRHTDHIFTLLMNHFHQLKWPKTSIIKISVWMGELKPMSEIPECWLPEWKQKERAAAAVDAVNEKFGLYTVKPARLLGFEIILPEVTGFLGDRTYQLNFQ